MSNRRIGFQERNNQTVRRPLSVFYGTHDIIEPPTESDPPVVDTTTSKNSDTKAQEAQSTEKSQQLTKNRSADKEKKETIRQTYYMEPAIVEAIKIMEFDTREGISTLMNRLLKECISDDILKQAENNLARRISRNN